MKVAIVHYHLRKGGVTHVIESALEALAPAGHDIVVLHGGPLESDAIPRAIEVPGLAYRDEATPADGSQLAIRMLDAATAALGGPPDLWHLHNHALGKNVAFPAALDALLATGTRVLLQIHDFAEDGRPANYARQRRALPNLPLYPVAPQVHYATLNRRDLDHLAAAGIPADQLHLLPNAVSPLPASPPPEPPFPKASHFVLYPTRGIRRKNLGELLLLSLLAGPGTVFATTLGPANPEWQPIHDRWLHLAAELRLPVELAFSERTTLSFPQLVAAADVIVSTSIAEGFGLAFLEPWLAAKTVIGRDLPAITADFKAELIPLDHLYPRLEIPLAWINPAALRDALHDGLQASAAAYGQALPPSALDLAWDATVRDHRVDFGRLSEPLQEAALRHAMAHPTQLDAVTQPRFEPLPAAQIAAARHQVETRYSIAGYGERLGHLYDLLLAAEPQTVTHLDPGLVLQRFLDPASFHLLRT